MTRWVIVAFIGSQLGSTPVWGQRTAEDGKLRFGIEPAGDTTTADQRGFTWVGARSPRNASGTLIATFAPYTHHRGKGDYNSRPRYQGLEWESARRWSVGGASFLNSFGQPCWYGFVGQRFQLKHRSGRFFAKVTAGVIHGYKAPHEHAVPLNRAGFCPAVIPSLGYHYGNMSVQFAVFGRAYGAMPMLSWHLR